MDRHPADVRADFGAGRKDHVEVHADIEPRPLSGINDVFERLDLGDVPSRVALDFTGPSIEPLAALHSYAASA